MNFDAASLCVFQNTYTNAEKLLEAADQLAQSGECEEEEIYQAARDLELRMQVTRQAAGRLSACFTRRESVSLTLFARVAGLHPAGGAEEAAAGSRRVFLHAYEGGKEQFTAPDESACLPSRDLCELVSL